MSALSAIEAAEFDEVAAGRGTRLRLVSVPPPADSRRGSARLAGVSRGSSAPRAGGSRAMVAALPDTARPAPGTAPAPLRLTRRGRLVVAVILLLLATVAITVASMTISGAQAANHGRPGGYAGMHQIVVQPGETLWSIASRAEPSADPRQVVAQIMTANSMASSAVQAGELLWVPK